MNDVAVFKPDRHPVNVSQRDIVAVLALQDFRAGVFIGPILYESGQESAIPVIHHNWFGETHRDFFGNAQLPHRQIGVARDDGTRAEIHALAHQVATNTPILAI